MFENKPVVECPDEDDPKLLIEDVLDTLVEVGNGATEEDLHKAADKLLKARRILFGK